jgi:4-hydroxyphenylpyruvate dioxygenase
MNIDHVHFYVEDAQQWQRWFVDQLGFELISTQMSSHSLTHVVGKQAVCFLISSPRAEESLVARYLRQHPAGVADLAFQVVNLEATVERAVARGAILLQPIQSTQTQAGWQQSAQVQGWGDLRHTLIEHPVEHPALPPLPNLLKKIDCSNHPIVETPPEFVSIDHVVLNVAQGDLQRALSWYETLFGFQRRQNFAIQTEHSALCSQVLTHPNGLVQFPINEPASAGSQIQEFLDLNRGPGIQHIALRTQGIVSLMGQLRQQGIGFLSVPATYYEQLCDRPGFPLSLAEWQAIFRQQVLVDWQPENPQALLLQAFTQPIFKQPTFFFELIERRSYRVNQQQRIAEGFGEGNFRALFEAIEREQMKRGSLKIQN